MKLGHRFLNVLDIGARPPRYLLLLAKHHGYTEAEFERAVGWLCLKGLVVFKGKTSGRVIARNGRRMK